jgi:hypothetical protein
MHDGMGLTGGLKIKDNVTDSFRWNTNAHKDRIVYYSKDRLNILSQAFENSDNFESAKLVSYSTPHFLDQRMSFLN